MFFWLPLSHYFSTLFCGISSSFSICNFATFPPLRLYKQNQDHNEYVYWLRRRQMCQINETLTILHNLRIADDQLFKNCHKIGLSLFKLKFEQKI